MRIDEHASAQDGSIRITNSGRSADIRVSIVPTLDGEKTVMRLLGEYLRGLSLAELGLTSKHEELLRTVAHRPFGMILVTGPTGSGKTTTLYALIKQLRTPSANLTTIEDPVEYRLTGVNQIQVNPETNLTFAKGLRALVRQDPDAILVGEIRDQETADIATNAALTGHLLFSTFHANDASSAIPRLIEMGIQPFLLSSTLELIVAQRLVRKLCQNCRVSKTVQIKTLPPEIAQAIQRKSEKTVTIYEAKGCDVCNASGYKGRTALFELLVATQEIRDILPQRPSSDALSEIALKQGMQTLFDNGIEKVLAGITSYQEVLRVAQPPARKKKQGKHEQ